MKKFFCALTLVAIVSGCATVGGNPDAFADYNTAMAHHDGYQMAYEWQRANPEAVVAATRPEALEAYVVTDTAADGLLAQIGTAYDGDPIALTQIAAVTQYVMGPERPKTRCGRATWVAALERAKARSSDAYVKTFCEQQLRLCRESQGPCE